MLSTNGVLNFNVVLPHRHWKLLVKVNVKANANATLCQSLNPPYGTRLLLQNHLLCFIPLLFTLLQKPYLRAAPPVGLNNASLGASHGDLLKGKANNKGFFKAKALFRSEIVENDESQDYACLFFNYSALLYFVVCFLQSLWLIWIVGSSLNQFITCTTLIFQCIFIGLCLGVNHQLSEWKGKLLACVEADLFWFERNVHLKEHFRNSPDAVIPHWHVPKPDY